MTDVERNRKSYEVFINTVDENVKNYNLKLAEIPNIREQMIKEIDTKLAKMENDYLNKISKLISYKSKVSCNGNQCIHKYTIIGNCQCICSFCSHVYEQSCEPFSLNDDYFYLDNKKIEK